MSCAVLIALAVLTSACSNDLASALTGPPGAAPPVFTLSGVVSETTLAGPAPVAGVSIQVQGTKPVVSDANGAYTISGLSALAATPVTISKFRFESQNRTVSITADTRLDLVMVRRPTVALSGIIYEIDATGEIYTPLEGVVVEVLTCETAVRDCASADSEMATTDRYGSYRVSGLLPGVSNNFLWASKPGYEPASPGPVGCDGCTRALSMSGDTHLDIGLVRH